MNLTQLMSGKGTYSLGAAGLLIGAIMMTSDLMTLMDDPMLTFQAGVRGLLHSEGLWVIFGNALFLLLRRGVDGQTEKVKAAADEMTDEKARQLLTKVLSDLQQQKGSQP